MKSRKRRGLPLWAALVLDVLVIGAVLVSFAFFHHVLPAIRVQQELDQMAANPGPRPTPQPTPSTDPTDPDGRTEWQKKFADKFSDEVILTENSYRSPEVSVTVETVVTTLGSKKVTYYVADIYVASLENFKTYTPHGQMKYFDTQPAGEMVRDSNAILAISGDFLTYQKSGFLLRNGVTYVADRNYSCCVLYADGTVETYDRGSYKVQDILDRDPLQVWSFGPVLLDPDGTVRDSYDVSTAVSYTNPRSAIGYYEPGHYCFVVVDGRQSHSKGMVMEELAQVFQDLGCKAAYNLDGGGTAVMLWDGQRISKQSNGSRDLGDILLITDPYYVQGGAE